MIGIIGAMEEEHCAEKKLLLSEAGLEKSMPQSAHRF